MERVTHDSRQLVMIFDQLFSDSHRTQLAGGAVEPLYQPASESDPFNRIFFREDYFASGLHEIAHWCLAGSRRREMIDFGYWYEPDGRNALQQARFERVEVKPQALQWVFSVAAGCSFRLSTDNLSGEKTDDSEFRRDVYLQAITYCREGLPLRANMFAQALGEFYGISVCEQMFNPNEV